MKTILVYTGASTAFQKQSPFTLHNRKCMSHDHSCRYSHIYVYVHSLLFRWRMRLRASIGQMGNLPIHIYGYNNEHDVIVYTSGSQSVVRVPLVVRELPLVVSRGISELYIN